MVITFRIVISSIVLFISALSILTATALFFQLNQLQSRLELINDSNITLDSQIPKKVKNIQVYHANYNLLFWDSEVSYTLALADMRVVAMMDHKGLEQLEKSKILQNLQEVRYFSPMNINSTILELSILIDQGAPLDFILPKIDILIGLTPKDQDLKAEIARLCFKLSLLNQDIAGQKKIINRLNKLFVYSMDYRGMTLVRRYARLFGQDDLVKKIDTNVRN